MSRVLGAIRLSRLSDESTSPERQREQIQAYGTAHGHEVVHITVDLDVSGSVSAWDRPELGPWLSRPELLARWDIVCAAKLDRLTRSTADFARLLEWSQKHGKDIVSLAEKFDLSGPHGRMVATILSSVAQFERERIAERRAEAAEWMRQDGRWAGTHIPWGYQAEPRPGGGWVLSPDPDVAPVVRAVVQKVISGQSVTALARELTDRGIPTSFGKTQWQPTSLRQLLRNPALRGWTTHKGAAVRDTDGLVISREAIIDDVTWQSLQNALDAAGRHPQARRKDADPLLRILFCKCGEPMYIQRRQGRQHFYICGSHKRAHAKPCGARMIPADRARALFERRLLQELADVERLIHVPAPIRDHAAEQAQVKEALAALEDQLLQGQVSAEAWTRMTARLEGKKASLEEDSERTPEDDWQPTGQTFGDYWDSLSEPGRHSYLVGSGVKAVAERRATFREPFYPRGDSAGPDIVIAVDKELGLTIHLGDLEELRRRAALHG
jgi:site-specific DNA recombinase